MKNITPYITFSIVATIVKYIYSVMYLGNIHSSIITYIIKSVTGFGIGALWFLPAYCIAICLYSFLKKKKTLIKIAFIFISIALACFTDAFLVNNGVLLSSIDYKVHGFVIYIISSMIVRGIVSTVFVLIGDYIGALIIKLTGRFKSWEIICVGIALLFMNLLLSQFNGHTNFSNLVLGRCSVLFFLIATIGSIGLITVVIGIYKIIPKIKFLEYCGRNSLILMVTHMSLMFTDVSRFVVSKIFDYSTENPIYPLLGIICLAIMIVMSIPVLYVLNGKLGFLIGKRNTNRK